MTECQNMRKHVTSGESIYALKGTETPTPWSSNHIQRFQSITDSPFCTYRIQEYNLLWGNGPVHKCLLHCRPTRNQQIQRGRVSWVYKGSHLNLASTNDHQTCSSRKQQAALVQRHIRPHYLHIFPNGANNQPCENMSWLPARDGMSPVLSSLLVI